jgi:16S rRNA (cytosine967-C5)-methyltransferase
MNMKYNARLEIVQQLMRIETDGAYMGFSRQEEGATARDKRQIMDEVAGITRSKRWLDFLIQSFYKGKVNSLEPKMRQILRLGVYELTESDKPDYAVVHECVELAKSALGRPKAGGLVNAILQALLRSKDALPKPQTGNAVQDLAIRHSHPDFLVQRWIKRFGVEATEQLLQANNRRPMHGLRVNLLKISVEDFTARLDSLGVLWQLSPFLPYILRVGSLQLILEAGLVQEGLCAVQDEAAAMVVRTLAPQPDEVIVDACAAPGGKALHAAMLMNNTGRIIALDKHPQRIGLIQQAATQQGVTNIEYVAADFIEWAKSFADNSDKVDKVLLDVPCSGTGVLAKRADLRWKKSQEELKALVALQKQLLEAAYSILKPDGVIIYSTCSIEAEENEDQIKDFTQGHPSMRIESVEPFISPIEATNMGFYQLSPTQFDTDGAFAARLGFKKDMTG